MLKLLHQIRPSKVPCSYIERKLVSVMRLDVEEAFLRRLQRIEEEQTRIRRILLMISGDLDVRKQNSVAIMRCVNEEEADE